MSTETFYMNDILEKFKGRVVDRFDMASTNVLGIFFIDGSHLEFEVVCTAPGLYGFVVSSHHIKDNVEEKVANIIKEVGFAAQCLECGDVVESMDLHDFATCSCGNVSVDGGTTCPRICSKSNNFELLND